MLMNGDGEGVDRADVAAGTLMTPDGRGHGDGECADGHRDDRSGAGEQHEVGTCGLASTRAGRSGQSAPGASSGRQSRSRGASRTEFRRAIVQPCGQHDVRITGRAHADWISAVSRMESTATEARSERVAW